MEDIEFIHSEYVEPRANRLDGAPADYWQQYADDRPPFVFPIVSAWVTKQLASPKTIEGQAFKIIRKHLLSLFCIFIIGLHWDFILAIPLAFIVWYRMANTLTVLFSDGRLKLLYIFKRRYIHATLGFFLSR